MKSLIHHIAIAVVALASGEIRTARASDLLIRHAAEIEFQTERGHYYQIQRSTNFVDWDNVEDRIYGHGGRENRLRSTYSGDTNAQEYFRVLVSDASSTGLAPWELKGITLELDDEPGGDLTKFLTDSTGVDVSANDNDPFTYTYTRTGTNEAKAELDYSNNRKEKLVLTFTGPGVGTWSREEFRDGRLKDHDAGPFRIVGVAPVAPGSTGTVNPSVIVAPPVATPNPPTSLSNVVYYFQASGVPDRYDFIDDHNGREVQGIVREGSPTNALVYTYTVLGSNTASLQINFGYYGAGGDRYDCDLTFTDGSSGHFQRRTYRKGRLKRTDEGAFSKNQNLDRPNDYGTNSPIVVTNPPAVWPPVITPTAAPAPLTSLQGRNCYVFLTPSPDRYQFTGPNYGYAFPGGGHGDEEIEVSPNGNVYTYSYKLGESNTATLVITYGYYNLGGDREEYDLEYVDGSTARFHRRLYRQGALYTNQAGLFSTNATLPYDMPGSTNAVPPGDYNFFMDTGEYLKFTSATAGVQTDDSNPTDFTYVYKVTGATTATLRVQFKSDKWDDYVLNYTDSKHGSFTRKQYQGNVLKDTDTGHFTAKQVGP